MLRKFDMNILQTCLPHLSDIATVPWEIQKKVIFNSIIHTYFWLFTLSQKSSFHAFLVVIDVCVTSNCTIVVASLIGLTATQIALTELLQAGCKTRSDVARKCQTSSRDWHLSHITLLFSWCGHNMQHFEMYCGCGIGLLVPSRPWNRSSRTNRLNSTENRPTRSIDST